MDCMVSARLVLGHWWTAIVSVGLVLLQCIVAVGLVLGQ